MKPNGLVEMFDVTAESNVQDSVHNPFLDLGNSSVPLEIINNLSDYNEQYDFISDISGNHDYMNRSMPLHNYSLLQQLTSDPSIDIHSLTSLSSFEPYTNFFPNSLVDSSQNRNMVKLNNNVCYYENHIPRTIPPNHLYKVDQHNQCQKERSTFKTPAMKNEKLRGKRKRSISPSEKTFCCLHCQSRFIRKDELRRHEKIHSGVRTLTCPYCDKTFIRSDHRKTHIRTHTGEKPYPCEICNKSFARSDERARHLKVHLKNGTIKRKTRKKFERLQIPESNSSKDVVDQSS